MMFNGEVAVVTGAARGIGFAIAEKFAKEGARPVVADIKGYGEAAGRIGGGAVGIGVDVSSPASLRKMFAEVDALCGRVDILVNNAGILHSSGIEDVTEEEWDGVLAVNLKGVFFASQAALPYLAKSPAPRIVNISSLAGRNGGFATGMAYTASKAGVIGITRGMARQLAPRGITVNAVAPGTTESDILKGFSPEALADLRTRVPVGRLGRPEDTAAAAAFLASRGAGFITGAVLDVNGGMFIG